MTQMGNSQGCPHSAELLGKAGRRRRSSIFRISAASLMSGKPFQHCLCRDFPSASPGLGISWDFPASNKLNFNKGTSLKQGSSACSHWKSGFSLLQQQLSNTSTGQHSLPARQIQVISRGNSRKHLGFVPTSINTTLSPCRRQETGSAGFYRPQRLRFHFLIFLLTWSEASSVKQACWAQGGCTGKCCKGEQCEIRS